MKQLFRIIFLATCTAFTISSTVVPYTHASSENIVSDFVYTNENAMSEAQIDAFISSFPKSCLLPKNYPSDISPASFIQPNSYFDYGTTQVSPARIIYTQAKYYHLNPRVILATLEKEQGLVSGNTIDGGCYAWHYNSAMGYNCPDNLTFHDYPDLKIYHTCVESVSHAGFARQVNHATWQLRFDQERAYGNTSWGGDGSVYYYGRMTQGWRARVQGQTPTYYDGTTVISGQTLQLANGSTAALYNYTPHFNSFESIFTNWFGSTQDGSAYISETSHVSNIGWMPLINNSGMIGTVGKNLPMEAFKIHGNVEYASYNYTTGWQPTVNKGMISGTVGQNKAIQAIKIKPIDTLAQMFDLYYRVHVSNIGWMDWAKNGEQAGISGDATNRIEAIEVRLLTKGTPSPGPTTKAYQDINTVTYSAPLSASVTAHVSTIGWQPTVLDGMTAGTTQQSVPIEAMRISLVNNTDTAGSILYNSQLSGIGWQGWMKDGAVSGTTGQGRQMEGFMALLTEPLASKYDLYYRAHSQAVGWLGWAKNGQPIGSQGAGYRLESIETRLVPKGASAPPMTTSGFYNPKNWTYPDLYTMKYSVHISNVGWVTDVSQNAVGGTVGQAKPLEAVRFDSDTLLSGSDMAVNCSAFVKGKSWVSDVPQTGICGTVGQAKPLESIKLTLGASGSSIYDIYYRVHLSTLGWQNWVKNGEQSGTPGSGYNIEAISVKLVPKS